MNNDLISREALKENIINICGKCSNIITKYENGIADGNCAIQHIMNIIDNAPAVSQINIFCENADEKTIEELKAEMQKAQLAVFDERPQGVWEIGYTAKQKKIAPCISMLENIGIKVIEQENISQKITIIDEKIIAQYSYFVN